MTVKKNILLIVIFIFAVLTLFINKLTSPRVLGTNELLINGLFLYESPKEISDFTFFSSNKKEFSKSDHSHLDNHVNNIILLNPNGEFAGIFRPPFDLPRLSLTYQSVTSK